MCHSWCCYDYTLSCTVGFAIKVNLSMQERVIFFNLLIYLIVNSVQCAETMLMVALYKKVYIIVIIISDVYNHGSVPLCQNVSNAQPMRWQSHRGENICDVSMVSLVACWPIFWPIFDLRICSQTANPITQYVLGTAQDQCTRSCLPLVCHRLRVQSHTWTKEPRLLAWIQYYLLRAWWSSSFIVNLFLANDQYFIYKHIWVARWHSPTPTSKP